MTQKSTNAPDTHKIMTDEQKELLDSYRDSIDNIDAALIHILAERFKITKSVGQFKAKYALPPADKDREKNQIEKLRSLSQAAKLDPDFSEKFLQFIITEVIRHHEQLRDIHK